MTEDMSAIEWKGERKNNWLRLFTIELCFNKDKVEPGVDFERELIVQATRGANAKLAILGWNFANRQSHNLHSKLWSSKKEKLLKCLLKAYKIF